VASKQNAKYVTKRLNKITNEAILVPK